MSRLCVCCLLVVGAYLLGSVAAQAPLTEGTGYGCFQNATRCCWTAPFSRDCPACDSSSRDVSQQYGCWGGFMRRGAGRLKYDWSYAGYMFGEQPLPATMRALANIKTDFGAKGDGRTDDTAAFEAAFKRLQGPGALIIPAGRYVITRALETWTGSLVLWGAGRDRTTLFFPKSLSEIYGNKFQEGGKCCTSDWSHSGAFIKFMSMDTTSPGGWDKTILASITANAAAGSRTLQLSTTRNISVGDMVRIHVTGDRPGSDAVNYMLGNVPGCTVAEPTKMLGSYAIMRFFSRVTAISGNTITLERHLPYDIFARWAPELHRQRVRIQYNGIQDLTMEFPVTPYAGHLKEAGWNAIFFRMTMHSWVRNVRILNADSGIYFWGVLHSTVDNVTVASSRPGARGRMAGHRAIWLEHGGENLVTRFRIGDTYHHDISLSSFEQGSVISEGSGPDLNIDFHRSVPYGNLITNLFFGNGTRPWIGSGGRYFGPHAGAYNTIWSVRASVPMRLPITGAYRWESGDPLGALFNWVDLKGANQTATLPWQWYLESFNQRGLAPSNLHRALVRERLGVARAQQIMAVPKPGWNMVAASNILATNPLLSSLFDSASFSGSDVPVSLAGEGVDLGAVTVPKAPAELAAEAAAAGAEDPQESTAGQWGDDVPPSRRK